MGTEGGTVTASGDADQIILGAGVDKTVYTTLLSLIHILLVFCFAFWLLATSGEQ